LGIDCASEQRLLGLGLLFWRVSPSSKIVLRLVDADSSAGDLEILEQFKAKIPFVNLENGLQHTCFLFAHLCSTPFENPHQRHARMLQFSSIPWQSSLSWSGGGA